MKQPLDQERKAIKITKHITSLFAFVDTLKCTCYFLADITWTHHGSYLRGEEKKVKEI